MEFIYFNTSNTEASTIMKTNKHTYCEICPFEKSHCHSRHFCLKINWDVHGKLASCVDNRDYTLLCICKGGLELRVSVEKGLGSGLGLGCPSPVDCLVQFFRCFGPECQVAWHCGQVKFSRATGDDAECTRGRNRAKLTGMMEHDFRHYLETRYFVEGRLQKWTVAYIETFVTNTTQAITRNPSIAPSCRKCTMCGKVNSRIEDTMVAGLTRSIKSKYGSITT